MNLLTKSLLEDLLDPQKNIAIYGGSFKPPTKGHFNVVKKILEELPDIDELKIFVGGGIRDGITQEESLTIWNIYKKYLSDKVTIEPSVAPVKSILNYAKENPDIKIYWILGAREGSEDDLNDIAERTRSLSKYPNIEVKIITSSGGISGTKTRNSIKNNNKEQFFHLIPDIKEKEQIWDILTTQTPNPEVINEGRYDNEVLNQSRYILNKFKENIGQKYKEKIKSKIIGINYNLYIDIAPSTIGRLGPNPFIITGQATEPNIIKINIRYIPSDFPKELNNLNAELKGTLRHELEHISQYNLNKNIEDEEDQDIPLYDYLILPSEIPAYVNELYKIAKTKKISLTQAIDDFFERYKYELSEEEINQIKNIWIQWAKKNLPKAQLNGKTDVFDLNKLAKEFVNEVFENNWNLKDIFVSLSKYMIDNGMNIKPLPKIKIIPNDKENASNILGKTAYYDPNNKSITLYTFGRHPKDIIRSFCHEVIHHIQNLEGRLNNINTTNTNEDGDLPEIEREAYEKGNMIFRNWEDNIKNKIDV
jgi:hypothetical protein